MDNESQYTDWSIYRDIKKTLNKDMTILLYKNGYPPERDEEVFEQVLEQTKNCNSSDTDDAYEPPDGNYSISFAAEIYV
ncbi:MAG: DUF3387 domain-containing protein [Treponema sp.]|jgi:type I restriction enzyme R subunit|nr:DUF3387 domain-containing protein [Treponema sp.]